MATVVHSTSPTVAVTAATTSNFNGNSKIDDDNDDMTIKQQHTDEGECDKTYAVTV